MKKLWLIPVLLALVLALCACGSDGDAEETIHSDVQVGNAEIELFSNESCALTLEKDGRDEAGDYYWSVRLENKTGSELTFSVDQVYVNEYEADPYWAVHAPAMQTTFSEISWFGSTLAACGVKTVDRVDLLLSVYPSSGTNLIAQEKLTVYPNGEAAYQPVSFTAGAGDTVLIDEPETLLFASTGADPDGEWGYTLNVYLENRSERTQEYTVENVKINGQLCDPGWYRTIDAGKKSFTYIYWYTDDLQHMEIYEVSKIEFDLVARDADTQMKTFEQHCVVEP